MKPKTFDLVFLVDAGIGNAIQTLYAVEYAMHQKVKVGFYLGGINASFQDYLKDCYAEVILDSIKDVYAKYLIHGFTYQKKDFPSFEQYFYVNADRYSSLQASETEQFLHIVRSIYPSDYFSTTLHYLKENYSQSVQDVLLSRKYVLYPGGSAVNPTRRWPHFQQLVEKLGEENCLIVGGSDDINYTFSYKYPRFLTTFLHQKILNSKTFWKLCKKMHLLEKHAHWEALEEKSYAFINHFKWAELLAIFKRCKAFVGNDGGLSHLAGAAGANGLVLFGPTSVAKNRPFNPAIKVIHQQMPCLPCQFGVGKVQMVKNYINCPYQIECLQSIDASAVLKILAQ